MNSILMQLARAGVATINPQSRNSTYLEWIERGSVVWDDDVAWSGSGVTILELNLRLSVARRG